MFIHLPPSSGTTLVRLPLNVVMQAARPLVEMQGRCQEEKAPPSSLSATVSRLNRFTKKG
jgi:hypothetical protein